MKSNVVTAFGVVCLLSKAWATQPLVAIQDSEFTQALATMPATGATPTGPGTTGYEWWVTNWPYFLMPETAEEALRSDGTAYQVVGDSNIISGQLLDSNGLPAYPIVISLACEAVSDREAAQLTNYVAAGGFLFVGSSSFTRDTNGVSRGDFAIAGAMGIHMATSNMSDWINDEFFTKVANNRIVQDIPSGTLQWLAPMSAQEVNWGISPNHGPNLFHIIWQVQSSDATVLAVGGTYANTNRQGSPYVLVKKFGKGYFIYDAAMQPLLGHNGFFPGMYAYMIFREAIEWAFEADKLPIPKLSPWPYPYNAAVMFRHDMEDFPAFINPIEASAQYEHSVGARGDYYFCTGTLPSEYTPTEESNEIASLQRAITLYGAVIGSHNGGLPNPDNSALTLTQYDYWHWGPDEVLDATNLPSGYSNGTEYAYIAISNSFADLEGWGLTNDSGLRQFTAPNFNADRERSKQILQQLDVAAAGEEKLTPFPHWTLSADTPGLRYSFLSLPPSDWFVNGTVAQSLEDGHTTATIQAMVNFYYQLGALINLYSHSSSAGGSAFSVQGIQTRPDLEQEYVTYSMNTNLFPRMWSANADSLYRWWVERSTAHIVPASTRVGNQSVTTLSITGSSDTNTAVEIFAATPSYAGIQVYTNGFLTDTNNYRTIGQTIRVWVGTTVTNVQIRYTPLPTAQNDVYYDQPGTTLTVPAPGVLTNDLAGWGTNLTAQLVSGPSNGSLNLNGDGSFSYTPTNGFMGTDSFTYQVNDGQTNSSPATVTITVMSPPVITVEPASVATNAGATVSFSVGATNGAPLSYQWFQNGTNSLSDGGDVSGSTSATLTLSSVLGGDAGPYTVVVSNPAGSVTSAPPAQLTVVDPVITTPPMGLVQNDGSRIELSVGAFGTEPLDYQWFADGQPIPGADDAVETLDGVTNGGTNSYSVLVSNVFGSVVGDVTNLQVFASGSLFTDDFNRGTNFGDISPWVAAQGTWMVTNQTLDATSLTLSLANAFVPGTNWGDYSVQADVEFPAGSYGGGLAGHVDPTTGARYAAWIYPAGSPGGSNVLELIKFFNWTDWSGTPMAEVALTNGVGTGWHALNLTFRANEILVYYDGLQMADVTDNNFGGLPPYLSGGISADVWAPSPAQAMIVSNVVVSEFPPTITNQPQGVVAGSGNDIAFTVAATGTDPLSYQWFKNGIALADGGDIYGCATSDLLVSNVSTLDAALYNVVVSNAFGTAISSNAVLTITNPPMIVTQPMNANVMVGTTATFTVQADGNDLSYQWYKNANLIGGATSSTLTLTNVSDSDAGTYAVLVSNIYGSVLSSNVTLTVQDCDPPPSDLVGWWPGDGNANDIAGTNNGILEGGATANAPGEVGTAFHFDGTNGYVEVPDASVLDPSNLTIAAWVKFDSLNSFSNSRQGHQYIVFKQNTQVSNFEGYGLGKDRLPTINSNGDVLYFDASSSSGVTAEVDSTNLTVQTNVWYFIAGVRGSNYVQFYVNGQFQGQAPASFPQNYGPEPLYFGTSGQSYWDGMLAGDLDEVSLFNRALTSNEIETIYLAGARGMCKEPIIVSQPASSTNNLGTTAAFTVVSGGSSPLTYQWIKNGTNNLADGGNISGATTATLTISNISSADAGNYSVLVENPYGATISSNAMLTISPTVVVTIVSGITVNNKIYDGTVTASISSNNVVLSGVLPADAGNVALSTNGYVATFANANVGAGIPVTVTGMTLTGSAAGNYVLSQPTGMRANIMGAPVTITSGITANNKVYDSTTAATLTTNNVVLNGVVAGDAGNIALSTNGYAANFASANVGTNIAVTVSGLTLTGSAANNYTLNQPSGLAANITGKAVTITSGITANNKVYDSTTAATLTTNNVVLNGVVAGDAGNIALSTNGYAANFASANVGTNIAVTVSGLTLTGSAANNYTLNQPSGLAANITGKAVTITSGITANNKVYDSTTAATLTTNNVVLNGVVAGDAGNIALSTNGYAANFASANVGTNIAVTVTGMTLTGSAAGNYVLSQPTGMRANIMGAPVTITSGITANNKVYDSTTAATLTTNNVVLNGVVAGDAGNIALSTNGYAANFASANVGTNIAVTVSGLTLTGSAANNYTLNQPSGLAANITGKAVTITSGITANNKVYDSTTAATLTTNNVVLNGVVAGDAGNIALSTNGYAANFASANVGTNIAVTVSGLTLTGSAANNYTLNQPSGLAANITGKAVTITSGITANNKVYDSTTAATLTTNNVVLNGVVAGDAGNIALSTNGYAANFASANVGTNIAVTVSGLTLTGSAANNYTLNQPSGLAANITGKAVTITSGITANNKVYDSTTAATLTTNNVVLNGVVAGDAGNIALSTNGYAANFASANVGTNIAVTVSGLTLTGSAANNYTLNQPSGLAANITGKAVTITSGITANNKVYDSTTAATLTTNNVVLNGVVAGDAGNIALSTNGYAANFASANVGTNIAVTVSGLTLTGSAANNYTLNQPSGLAANITPKVLSIVAVPPPVITSIRVTNGIANITWTSVAGGVYRAQYRNDLGSGVWNDLTPDVTATTSTATQTDNVAGLSQRFYRIMVPHPGFAANNKVYDGTTTATISSNNVALNGVLNGDMVYVSTNGYTANFVSPNVGTGIPVMLTGLALAGPDAGNYTLSQPVILSANIMPITLTVSANNQTKTAGLPNPPLTVSYSGFANGEGTNALFGAPSVSTTAKTNSAPGPYPIAVGMGTLSATNYIFAFINGTLTVMAVPQLSGVALSSNQFVFSWPTIVNQTYQLQYKDNLGATNWIPFGSPIPGMGNPLNITNFLGTSTQRFFRLVVSP